MTGKSGFATTAPERLSYLPDIPLEESGTADLVTVTWQVDGTRRHSARDHQPTVF